MSDEYDIVIAGSGLGALVCGAILSREGYSVCILEKNRQFGGCLQSFSRDRALFDSGVHYIGGLAEGQTLYQVFKYLGLIGKLKLQQMDEAVFDKIVFLEDGKEYSYAQGYELFIETLCVDFPEEREAIEQYCAKMKEICARFPLYNLKAGDGMDEKMEVLGIDTKGYIASITNNLRLQEVLAGNNLLYAGIADQTPFYVHSLVLNSYIESSWKCVDGGAQITKFLVRSIREHGGTVENYKKVVRFLEEEGKITALELSDGTKVRGKQFISNLHPAQTLKMTDSRLIRPAYRKRIDSLTNSKSSFCVFAVLMPGQVPYHKHNYYIHAKNGVWNGINCARDEWPSSFCVFFSASSRSSAFAESITILTYMPIEEMTSWEQSINTDSAPQYRGEGYKEMKDEKAAKLLAMLEKKFPGIGDQIQSFYTSTPLSYRDYIGTTDGSMYGIVKDYKDPMSSFISPKTRIPNLFLTGQNLLLHGIMGVTMSALATSSSFIGMEKLIEKIKNA